jgi:SepF-like predicted cell division protein (DUF552 family)
VTILKKKPFPSSQDAEGRQHTSAEQYIDLSEMSFDDERLMGGSEEGTMVKVGEIFRYEDLSMLTSQVYSGNLVVLDFTSIANDDLTMKRITSELKNVARDVNGDVAGIGKNLVLVTPQGIRIDRAKIKGGF